MKHGAGVSNIEITDQNIEAFSATAKKYGIDFALKKDTTGEIPRYLVFFKGRDADAVTAAFRAVSYTHLRRIAWRPVLCQQKTVTGYQISQSKSRI